MDADGCRARRLGRAWRRDQVFLLTDGEVSNTDAVVQLCKRQHDATGARVFTFGIGADVSHALVKGAATAGVCVLGGTPPLCVRSTRSYRMVVRPSVQAVVTTRW